MVAVAALVSWILNVVVGLVMVLRWPKTGVVLTHLAIGFVGIAAWAFYLAGDRPGWQALIALVILLVGNGIGDVLMVRSYRRRGGTATGATAYAAAAGEVIALRQLPTMHGGLAGVTTVLVVLALFGL